MGENLAILSWYAITVLGMSGKVKFFCQDETRIGLKTIGGRKITTRGIKPKVVKLKKSINENKK